MTYFRIFDLDSSQVVLKLELNNKAGKMKFNIWKFDLDSWSWFLGLQTRNHLVTKRSLWHIFWKSDHWPTFENLTLIIFGIRSQHKIILWENKVTVTYLGIFDLQCIILIKEFLRFELNKNSLGDKLWSLWLTSAKFYFNSLWYFTFAVYDIIFSKTE